MNPLTKVFRPLAIAGMLTAFSASFSLSGSNSTESIDSAEMTTTHLTLNVNVDADAGTGAGLIRFDGIGIVNGGGATSVLLKDYPEPQRSQMLDLVFKPKFGASVSTLLVEVPGDGNSTQGSMPSHMRTREDLNYYRGYMWWVMKEAKKRNPHLSLDGAAWSAPGWPGDGEFCSQDTADYYVKWLQGLKALHGLEMDALGCRNEQIITFEFAEMLRQSLDRNGFENILLHGFDHWPEWKFDFVTEMYQHPRWQKALDVIGAHVMYAKEQGHASAEVQRMAQEMGKPIWNTEDHVYLKGFDCAIGIVECFNDNFIHSGATKIVNWYDIGGIYEMEPYSEDPPMIRACWPWSGHYVVRENLWGYAHYGQFTEIGWQYITSACRELKAGGSVIAMKSPAQSDADYSIIIETKDAKIPQTLVIAVPTSLSTEDLCVWRSNEHDLFLQLADLKVVSGMLSITVDPQSIYSLSTTRGQQKGGFSDIPDQQSFPFPYKENYEAYRDPQQWGYLPRYHADIEEVFELGKRPDGEGFCLQQVSPIRPNAWAPSWQPYTIIGDSDWSDYEVSVDVLLHAEDTAGVMGRVNHVGTGWGTIPKGYFFQISSNGTAELIIVRGKIDKKKLVGDAEQQAQILASGDTSIGGERTLASTNLPGILPGKWYRLTLCFKGSTLIAKIDGTAVLEAVDETYPTGMAGLIAHSRNRKELSMPFFDNLAIGPQDSTFPSDFAPAELHHQPLYSIE